jgi:hypothetical protein
MTAQRKPLQHFNLETMSGVYPGTRTSVYRKLLSPGGVWHTLSWYTAPPSLTLTATPGAAVAAWEVPPEPAHFLPELAASLEEVAIQPQACFACRHWRPLATTDSDGIPLGHCGWGQTDAVAPRPAHRLLAVQSALSLACDHFAQGPAPDAHTTGPAPLPDPAPTLLPRAAELDPDRLPFWPRLRRHLAARFRAYTPAPPSWEQQLVERSGVGAGTEPCFVCQGRLANLGALTVACDAGDKQTFSIWRCRTCHTLYLNDWTDRWERLDNLETEELYYRIAPAEAYAVLRIIHTTPGGDHPARRAERSGLRAQILIMLQGKTPLSHQIRQGR